MAERSLARAAADTLAAITAREELEALAQRVLTAADWPSLLAKQ